MNLLSLKLVGEIGAKTMWVAHAHSGGPPRPAPENLPIANAHRLPLTYPVFPYNARNYLSQAFAADGSTPTMHTTDPSYQERIGQREGLSFYDIELINSLYGCVEKACPQTVSCPPGAQTGLDCRCYCPTDNPEAPLALCKFLLKFKWGFYLKAGVSWPAWLVMLSWDNIEVGSHCLPQVTAWGPVNLSLWFTVYISPDKNSASLNEGVRWIFTK